jgi:hypothetical protein
MTHSKRNQHQNVAMVSDALIALVLLSAVIRIALGK